ncbi:hypothetical protein H2248_003021 [Termitomyces sp. 'cryptogamus']|nr:hypothetical protein H2248_003021 [Termitomyces sp. 'cryptogamus']
MKPIVLQTIVNLHHRGTDERACLPYPWKRHDRKEPPDLRDGILHKQKEKAFDKQVETIHQRFFGTVPEELQPSLQTIPSSFTNVSEMITLVKHLAYPREIQTDKGARTADPAAS